MMKKILKYFFSFLASMNLAICILSFIALLVILQSTSGKLATIFKSSNWLVETASTDFYQSKVLLAALIFFCVNLIACTLKRLPLTIHVLKKPAYELDDDLINFFPVIKKFMADDCSRSSEQLLSCLSNFFKRPKFVNKGNEQLKLWAEKGRYTHLGFYLAHLGILVIVIGIIFSLGGYEYSFEIRKDQILNPLIIRDDRGNKKELNFSLLCEDIQTVFEQGTSEIKKRQSTLAIFHDGKKKKTQTVDFGTHLNYQGVSIYQNLTQQANKIRFAKIKVIAKAGDNQFYEVNPGSSFTIKGTDTVIIATRWKDNAIWIRARSSPERIEVSNKPTSFSDSALNDYRFVLEEIVEKEVVGLKAVSDPGREIIWLGFFGMVLGFSICFYLSHQQVFAKIETLEDKCIITLAGTATKEQGPIEVLFEKIQCELCKA